MRYLEGSKLINYFFVTGFLTLVFYSCAQKGSPSGGPKDITPPKLLKSAPDTLSVHVDVETKEIKLEFDEYVKLKDYVKQVLISPPIDPSPTFMPSTSAAKEVRVMFNSSLKENTTYTINFGESIVDNNEGNILPFTYVFSTGETIDSLEMKGKVNVLGERKEQENLLVALYKIDTAYTDSVVLSQKPYYVTKVDTLGDFQFKYLHEGNYKMLAYQDEVADLVWSAHQSEKMGFVAGEVNPTETKEFDIAIYQPQLEYRFIEAKEADYGKLDFVFEGKPERVKIIPIDPQLTTQKIFHKPYSDTLQFWFNPSIDSLTDKRPRLKFAIEHNGERDTIPSISYNKDREKELLVYGRKLYYTKGKNYEIEASYPIDTVYKEKISVMEDSTLLDFTVKRLQKNRFALDFPIKFERKYQIDLQPGAIKDIFKTESDTLQFKFETQSEQDVGNLKLTLTNTPNSLYWVKLFSKDNNEIQSVYGKEKSIQFQNLRPGEYYFQLIVDENENGRWDTGNFFENKQPEKIYTYKENIIIRAYWDSEETWVLPEQ